MNLTVTSHGLQTDRMGGVWLENIEVWRFSTPQPSDKPGIRWTMIKDVTPFLVLWRKKNQLLLDLDNRNLWGLNGKFDVSLTATYMTADLPVPAAKPATHILPLGTLTTREANYYDFPLMDYPNRAILPSNAVRAVLSIGATALSREEFWWSNLPNSLAGIYSNKTRLPDRSSFREIRLRIDDQLAGFAWPQPIVQAGGVSPALHRPIVSDQIFDLAEHEIDITPWLGVLCDKQKHRYNITIVGQDGLIVPAFWKVSAKIFVWTDHENRITQGPPPHVNVSEPEVITSHSKEFNDEWKYSLSTTRSIDVRSKLNIKGESVHVSWAQRFSMRGEGHIGRKGDYQWCSSFYEGESTLTQNLLPYYHRGFSYPIEMTLDKETLPNTKAFRLRAEIDHGMNMTVIGKSVFPSGLEPYIHDLKTRVSGSTSYARKRGHAILYQTAKGKTSVSESDVESVYLFGAKPMSLDFGAAFAADPMLFTHEMRQINEAIVKNTMFMAGARSPSLPVATYAPDPRYIGWFAPINNKKHGGTRIFWGRDALTTNAGDYEGYAYPYGGRRARSLESAKATDVTRRFGPATVEESAEDDDSLDDLNGSEGGFDFDAVDGDLLAAFEREFEKFDTENLPPRPSPTKTYIPTAAPDGKELPKHRDQPWRIHVGDEPVLPENVTINGLLYPKVTATSAPAFGGHRGGAGRKTVPAGTKWLDEEELVPEDGIMDEAGIYIDP